MTLGLAVPTSCRSLDTVFNLWGPLVWFLVYITCKTLNNFNARIAFQKKFEKLEQPCRNKKKLFLLADSFIFVSKFLTSDIPNWKFTHSSRGTTYLDDVGHNRFLANLPLDPTCAKNIYVNSWKIGSKFSASEALEIFSLTPTNHQISSSGSICKLNGLATCAFSRDWQHQPNKNSSYDMRICSLDSLRLFWHRDFHF